MWIDLPPRGRELTRHETTDSDWRVLGWGGNLDQGKPDPNLASLRDIAEETPNARSRL